ncbi:MAG: IS200/IS605 family transposase [Eubacteriales bacterium]|nr:IS200/IS605 family transposase [Eubacteriales bacterium]
MEMPVPYRFHSEISEESIVWEAERRRKKIISTFCKYKDVEIIAGAVCVGHVHLSVAIPPKLSVSNFMRYLKGKSTLMIYDRYPEQQSKWDKAFWARGYYVETIGNITDEAVQKYINEPAEESRREDLRSTAL